MEEAGRWRVFSHPTQDDLKTAFIDFLMKFNDRNFPIDSMDTYLHPQVKAFAIHSAVKHADNLKAVKVWLELERQENAQILNVDDASLNPVVNVTRFSGWVETDNLQWQDDTNTQANPYDVLKIHFDYVYDTDKTLWLATRLKTRQ
jgi:hypothetical protein